MCGIISTEIKSLRDRYVINSQSIVSEFMHKQFIINSMSSGGTPYL